MVNSSETLEHGIASQQEMATRQSKILEAFAKEKEFRKSLYEYIETQEAAEFDAPAGFLVSITTTEDGALTEVWDAGTDRASYHPVKMGETRYATGLRYTPHGGRGELRTSHGRASTSARAYYDYPYPYILNHGGFELGLIRVEEYLERRKSGDDTLFHTRQTDVAE